MPVSFPAQTYRDSSFERCPKLHKFFDLGSAPPPLFPIAHPDPSTEPFVQQRDRSVILRYTEVVYPAPDVFSKLFHPVEHGYAPTPAGQFFDPSLEFPKGLIRPSDCFAFEGKSQECALVNGCYSTLLFIYFELEMSFQKAANCFHHPLPSTSAFKQDDKVIGVSGESVPPLFQFFVQIIKEYVGQQW